MVDFKEVKADNDILSVAQRLGLQLKASGEQQRGQCPRCKGGDRDLVITPAKSLFFCFKAKKGGDQIALVAHMKDMEQKAAAEWLTGSATVEKKEVLQPLAYLEAEHEDVQALDVSPETCKHFEAGYAPKGIMRGRLAIPIHDITGTLIAYCGRTVKNDAPRLTFPKDFDPTAHIFNGNRVTGTEVYLAFDPLTVLTAYANGVENCISFLTDGINAAQLRRLAAFMNEKQIETAHMF